MKEVPVRNITQSSPSAQELVLGSVNFREFFKTPAV